MSIRCGNCKRDHDDAQAVFDCMMGGVKNLDLEVQDTEPEPVPVSVTAAPSDPDPKNAWKFRAASVKQNGYLESLLAARPSVGVLDMQSPSGITEQIDSLQVLELIQRRELLGWQASALIGLLKALPPEAGARPAGSGYIEGSLSDGLYVVDEGGVSSIYKVQVSKTSKKQYAKYLDMSGVPATKASFEYAGRSPLGKIARDGVALTYEKAVELGHLYGICAICGALLEDPKSVEAGIGPVCKRKVK